MRFLDWLLRRSGDHAQIESIDVNPPTVLVGEPFTITVATSETGPRCTVTGVLYGPGGERLRLRFARVGKSIFQQAWKAETTINAGVGRWRADAEVAEDPAETAFNVADRTTAVETRIRDFTVEPEPVNPGERLTFSGRLERAAGRDDWTGLPGGQPILLSFRADDEFAWRVITETKTGEGSAFTATATAVESGLWRAEFPGTLELRAARSNEVQSTAARSEGDVKLTHTPKPKRVKKGKKVNHRGTVHYWTVNGWRNVGGNRTVILRVNGTDQPGTSDTTDSDGRYKITERAQASGGRLVVFRKQGNYSAGQSAPASQVTVTN